MLVPQGYRFTCFADTYELVWPSGKVGRKRFMRKPSKEETKKLLGNISIALRKMRSYEHELLKARKVLQCQAK